MGMHPSVLRRRCCAGNCLRFILLWLGPLLADRRDLGALGDLIAGSGYDTTTPAPKNPRLRLAYRTSCALLSTLHVVFFKHAAIVGRSEPIERRKSRSGGWPTTVGCAGCFA